MTQQTFRNARGRQWCGIFHYHWWTASIKPRLLFSHSGLVSWGLPFLQFNFTNPSILFILPFQWLKQIFGHFDILKRVFYVLWHNLYIGLSCFCFVAMEASFKLHQIVPKPLLQSEKLNIIEILSPIQFFFLYFLKLKNHF